MPARRGRHPVRRRHLVADAGPRCLPGGRPDIAAVRSEKNPSNARSARSAGSSTAAILGIVCEPPGRALSKHQPCPWRACHGPARSHPLVRNRGGQRSEKKPEILMRYASAARQHRIPADSSRPPRNAPGQSRLPLQPELRTCHVNAGPRRTEEMSADSIDAYRLFGANREIRTPRSHRRRARDESSLQTPGARHALARGAGDRPLQSHHSRRAGFEDMAAFTRRTPGRDRRVAALLPGGQRRQATRQGHLRRQHPRLHRLNARLRRHHGFAASQPWYNPQGPVLPPPQGNRSRPKAPRR